MPDGIELRLGADTRRTSGETRELANYVAAHPTRRRHAGGETWTGGAFAEASLETRGIVLSGGARADFLQGSQGEHVEQDTLTRAVSHHGPFSARRGLPPARFASARMSTRCGCAGSRPRPNGRADRGRCAPAPA